MWLCGRNRRLERRLSFFFFFFFKGRENYAFASNKFWLATFSTPQELRKGGAAVEQNFPVPSIFPVLEWSLYASAYTFWGVNLCTSFGESTGTCSCSSKWDLICLGTCFYTLWDNTIVFLKWRTCYVMNYAFSRVSCTHLLRNRLECKVDSLKGVLTPPGGLLKFVWVTFFYTLWD